MSVKAVLFDLDGTLLPMDLRVFFGEYFKLLTAKLAPYGYEDPKALIRTMWQGVAKVCENDGKRKNGEVFWDYFASVYGEKVREHVPVIDRFYLEEFEKVKEVCGFDPEANKTVKALKEKGLKCVIATKPIFPLQAILKRMEWAGLDKNDFEFCTSYDVCSFCKPQKEYYEEVAALLGLSTEECLMVGNDVDDDMPAEKSGMKVFLLTNHLINTDNKDISNYRQGNFQNLIEYINELI
jgi:FMN phosphatase YigB (HAD superfamily)